MAFWSTQISVSHSRRRIVIRRRTGAIVVAGFAFALLYFGIRGQTYHYDHDDLRIFWPFIGLGAVVFDLAWLVYQSGHTMVKERGREILVLHGLFGLWSRLAVELDAIEGLDVTRFRKGHRDRRWGRLPVSRLQLVARLRDERALVLVPNLGSRKRADLVRRALEEWLEGRGGVRPAAPSDEDEATVALADAPDRHEPPPGFQVHEHGVRLVLLKSWRTPKRWSFTAVWLVIMTGFLAHLILIACGSGGAPASHRWLAFGVLLGINLLLCALWLTSRTVVTVDGQTLRVHHRRGILPMRRTFRAGDLERLRAVRTVHNVSTEYEVRRRAVRFHLDAETRDGGRERLVTNLESRQDVLFLGKVIAERMAIPFRGFTRDPS
jgi:hypothetical protein